MNHIFDQQDHDKFRFWNTAPVNPLDRAKKSGTPYMTGKALMPESPMPVGEHVGKTMRQVPRAYLRWVSAQPWASQWRHWAPVADYLARHPLALDALPSEEPRAPVVIYVDPLLACTPTPRWRWPSACHLHCLPGFEAELHAFALGALNMNRAWYQDMRPDSAPHYDLNESRQTHALAAGAELIDRRQMAAHIRLWRESRGSPVPREGTEFVRVMPGGEQRCTKHCYPTEAEAQAKIKAILHGERFARSHNKFRAQGCRKNTPEFLRAYACPDCGFFHLTRQR